MLEATTPLGQSYRTTVNKTTPFYIETQGLVYEAGGKRLIDGIDLKLSTNFITVVMGANGAGKSLLLRLLHGLIAPNAGRVLWSGEPPTETLRKRQAMVFQRPVLLRRSVAANIKFVLNLNATANSDRCHELLCHVGLAAQANQPARLLSAGEQQRLALARALALEPEIMFLDEPSANLDPSSVAAIESIVRTAHEQGTKIILVTHDLGQARRLADEVIFLHHGRLLEHTPAPLFFDQPTSKEARDYIAGKLVL